MAVTHIHFDKTAHGQMIEQALENLEKGRFVLNEALGVMALMIDGDGSAASQFPYMRTKFGFSTDADAKAAWDELNSLSFKLNTNASVTDVSNALTQAFNKFRTGI